MIEQTIKNIERKLKNIKLKQHVKVSSLSSDGITVSVQLYKVK